METDRESNYGATGPEPEPEAEKSSKLLTALNDGQVVALQINTRKPGTRVKVESAVVIPSSLQVDPASLDVFKVLVQSKTLRRIYSLDQTIYRYAFQKSIPWILKKGIYLLSTAKVEEVEAELNLFAAKRRDLIALFTTELPDLIEDAKRRLGELFDETNYLNEDRIAASFEFEWSYFTFGTPAALKGVSAALFEREREKAAAKWQEAQQSISDFLMAELKDLLDHMIDRLTLDDSGEKRIFKGSSLEKIKEFVGDFRDRSIAITNSSELDAIVTKVKDALEGVDAESLRNVDSLRESTRETFSLIKAELDEMVVNAPRRMLALD